MRHDLGLTQEIINKLWSESPARHKSKAFITNRLKAQYLVETMIYELEDLITDKK